MTEGEGNPEQEYEHLRDALLGLFDELVAEAEDLVEDQGGGVIRETEDTAQLWEELKEHYGLVTADLDRRGEVLGEMVLAQLRADLQELKAKAEKAFGVSVSGQS